MNPITLKSHARAPDPNNTKTITFNDGKPETIVEGETEGHRMRRPFEIVHYREYESDPICAKCHRPAEVWHGSLDRWEAHHMRCQWVSNTINSGPAIAGAGPILGRTHMANWRRL